MSKKIRMDSYNPGGKLTRVEVFLPRIIVDFLDEERKARSYSSLSEYLRIIIVENAYRRKIRVQEKRALGRKVD